MKIRNRKINAFCCALILCIALAVPAASAGQEVYVGGMPFGIRFDSGEVVVVKTNSFMSGGNAVSPAMDAGICGNDIIKSIDGAPVCSMNDVVTAVQKTDKDILKIVVERDGKEVNVELKPMKNDETSTKQLGVMLKDSSAGIGTVTFVDEDSLSFAGLGHGICDSSSGKLLKIENGYISDVTITDICKGKSGAPGELRGTIDSEKCGKLISNTEVGVYGIFTETPDELAEKIVVADKNEVHTGKATILCTLDDNKREEYEIEISQIQHFTDAKTKNFIIKVTDKELLQKTGGIVQGMSGSPIIQDGKLVGAVTHVLINDPTAGYGIFIENMLEAV